MLDLVQKNDYVSNFSPQFRNLLQCIETPATRSSSPMARIHAIQSPPPPQVLAAIVACKGRPGRKGCHPHVHSVRGGSGTSTAGGGRGPTDQGGPPLPVLPVPHQRSDGRDAGGVRRRWCVPARPHPRAKRKERKILCLAGFSCFWTSSSWEVRSSRVLIILKMAEFLFGFAEHSHLFNQVRGFSLTRPQTLNEHSPITKQVTVAIGVVQKGFVPFGKRWIINFYLPA